MNDLAEQLSAEFGLTIEQVMDMFGRIKRFANDTIPGFGNLLDSILYSSSQEAGEPRTGGTDQKDLPPTVSLPHSPGEEVQLPVGIVSSKEILLQFGLGSRSMIN